MLVRIFEYATQIALDQGVIIENTLKVEILKAEYADIMARFRAYTYLRCHSGQEFHLALEEFSARHLDVAAELEEIQPS